MAYREDRSIPETPLPRETAEARPAGPVAAPAAAKPEIPVAAPTEAASPPRSRKKLVLRTLLVLGLGFGAYMGYGWWTNGRFMVSTDDAYVAADITILAAKVPGYVTAVQAQNNDTVRAGQVIARIDDVDAKLAVASAEGKLQSQRATVERIARQIEAAGAQVAQAEPQIGAAQADALRTAADFERQTRLAQGDFASKARLEQAKADRDRSDAQVKIAEAGLLTARANVDVLRAQKIEAERVADEAQVMLDRAKRDLSFTEVRAPVDGTVGNRAVEVGAYVQPGTRLMAIVPLASVRVDANFKETQLAKIRPGQRVHLEVDAYPGEDFPATVESIAPASGSQFSLLPPENATGNFTKIVQRVPVRVKVDPEVAARGLLRPGMSALVRIDSRDRPGAVAPKAE